MTTKPIDLRSDTVTRPSPGMRKAMAEAEVGDDVIDIDPTVERLQHRVAEVLGKEAAIFMPSGSMTNQIAVRTHCKPGDEFLCEAGCHIINYEQAAYAQLSGVAMNPVQGDGGVLHVDQLRALIRPENEHCVRTRMVTIENTHNRGAGRIQPYQQVVDICDWAREQGLARHLDGARLFNAVVASGISAADWSQHFDTVSICFSKGLGAPVGSALAGTKTQIAEARCHRKLFGGGMRQAGIIAAGALYALEHNIERLAEDHEKARILEEGIRTTSILTPDRVDTNMVIFEVAPAWGTGEAFVNRLEEAGVRSFTVSAQKIRMVTHLDVDLCDIKAAVKIIQDIAACSNT